MGRPKLIEEGTRVSTVVSKKQHDRLRHMAIRMSAQTGRQIGISEAIRIAIEAAYPILKPEQNSEDDAKLIKSLLQKTF